MEYQTQFERMRTMVKESNNPNLIKDFFVQYSNVRTLYTEFILNYLDNVPIENPLWLSKVKRSDMRNIVVFLMWKEHETVIDAMSSTYDEESCLGKHIEDLGVFLETMYYIKQIGDLETSSESYIDWIKSSVDNNGLVYTIEQLMTLCFSTG
jgi:hypothetical protein